jgi:multidrug efflux pump subunit AcrB
LSFAVITSAPIVGNKVKRICVAAKKIDEGTMGKFIYVIPLVVIFALVLSFLEVTIALPAHLAGLNEKPQKKHWFNAIEDWFEKVLKKILKLRYLIVIGTVVNIVTITGIITRLKPFTAD